MFGAAGGAGAGGGPAGFRAPRGPRRGEDLSAEVSLPFRQAVEGAQLSLRVDDPRTGPRTVNARVPAGVRDGQKIRLRGKGRPGSPGAEPGDLVVAVHVATDPLFALDGRDLRITVPVTFVEATLGGEVEVPVFEGGSVRVKVPAGTPSGRVLRVRGRGVRTSAHTGDLLVTVQVVVPQRVDAAARAALEEFAAHTAGDDPRAESWVGPGGPRGPAMAGERGARGIAADGAGEWRVDVELELDDATPVFVISVAAQLAGMHPQTLRQYDRLGLVTPGRAAGRGRRYSARDVAVLREVQRLSQEEGVNLAGIKRILELELEVDGLRAQLDRLREELADVRARLLTGRRVFAAGPEGDIVAMPPGRRPQRVAPSTALVVWRPPYRR